MATATHPRPAAAAAPANAPAGRMTFGKPVRSEIPAKPSAGAEPSTIRMPALPPAAAVPAPSSPRAATATPAGIERAPTTDARTVRMPALPPGSGGAAAPSPRAPIATPASGARPAPAAPSGEPQLRRIYDEYVAARRRNNEPTDNLAYDKLASSVRQMESKLREKHGDKRIDFEVVVRDGRVGLRPKVE